MDKITNKTDVTRKEMTKEEIAAQLSEEIVVLKLELEHATLIANIQEQSTRRSSLIVQEANIIGSNQEASNSKDRESDKKEK